MQPADVQVDLVHAAQDNVTHMTVRRQGYGPMVSIAKTVTKGGETKYTHEFSVPADDQLVGRMVLLGLLAHRLEYHEDTTHCIACALSVEGKMYAWSTGELTREWRQALTASVLGTGSQRFPSCHEYLCCLFSSL